MIKIPRAENPVRLIIPNLTAAPKITPVPGLPVGTSGGTLAVTRPAFPKIRAKPCIPTARKEAMRAWQEHHLLQNALAAESAPVAIAPEVASAVNAFETGWDQYFAERDGIIAPRSYLIRQIAMHCDKGAWGSLTPTSFLESRSDADLNLLYGATTFIRFFRDIGAKYQSSVSLTHFFAEPGLTHFYNCVSSSVIALHALQRSGMTALGVFNFPKHTTVGLKLENGIVVYLNNGSEILPPDFFDSPTSRTGFDQHGREELLPSWAALSAIHSTVGIKKYIERKEAKIAIRELRRALTISPDNANACLNLGVIYAELGKAVIAQKYLRKALSINPECIEARQKWDETVSGT